jgi:hypothetical protein
MATKKTFVLYYFGAGEYFAVQSGGRADYMKKNGLYPDAFDHFIASAAWQLKKFSKAKPEDCPDLVSAIKSRHSDNVKFVSRLS